MELRRAHRGGFCIMWFDPVRLMQNADAPSATLATSATFTQSPTANDGRVARIAEVATPQEVKTADARHFRWLVHFADREPVEVRCSPDATHAEILECRPDALAAEPIPERIKRQATPEQESELRALVAAVGVAYAFTPAEQQEALDLALWDVEAALQSYRVMANEQNIILDRDDRRRCDQCANLSHGGKCAAWQAVGAMRGYSPVRDIPRRCEGYAPGADDPDKRPGGERWPELIQNQEIDNG